MLVDITSCAQLRWSLRRRLRPPMRRRFARSARRDRRIRRRSPTSSRRPASRSTSGPGAGGRVPYALSSARLRRTAGRSHPHAGRYRRRRPGRPDHELLRRGHGHDEPGRVRRRLGLRRHAHGHVTGCSIATATARPTIAADRASGNGRQLSAQRPVGLRLRRFGNVYFGLGENLGADYRLIGADGTTLTGGGEGGSIYRCRPDGTKLDARGDRLLESVSSLLRRL